MMTLYELWHFFDLSKELEESKFFGVFSSKENAQNAASILKDRPEFAAHPDKFEIHEVSLDKVMWTDGFFTA